MNNETYIEIVASSNPRLNAMAAKSQQSILATLRQHYAKVAITIIDDLSGLEKLVSKQPDLVILGMKRLILNASFGKGSGPTLWLADYLEQYNINYVGSRKAAMQLQFDKQIAKQKVMAVGLASSAYFIAEVNQPTPKHELNFPLFVKPANRGGSKGIDEQSVAYSQAALEAKIRVIHTEWKSDALVEEYLPGREFSVAVIEQPGTEEPLAMPVEILSPPDSNGNSFLSKAIKHADLEKVYAVSDPELKGRLNALAIRVFEELGARDYGRIDLRLDSLGNPSFMEANLTPGLSNHGYLSRCFLANAHIDYHDMILQIVGLALGRNKRSMIHVMPSESPLDIIDAADLSFLPV